MASPVHSADELLSATESGGALSQVAGAAGQDACSAPGALDTVSTGIPT